MTWAVIKEERITLWFTERRYNFDSENFKVSLLKHEAQHARDLCVAPNMASEDLEYRAKLVELIYSEERPLLDQFLCEADQADKGNGHAVAANRIIEGFSQALNRERSALFEIPLDKVRYIARKLFDESSKQLEIMKK